MKQYLKILEKELLDTLLALERGSTSRIMLKLTIIASVFAERVTGVLFFAYVYILYVSQPDFMFLLFILTLGG